MIRPAPSLLVAVVVGLASWTATAQADLLINPTGGSTISYSDPDDGSVTRQLGSTFTYYGTAITSISVGVNGNLSLSTFTGFKDAPLSGLSNVIAPFYDDLFLYNGGTVSDQTASNYYAVTWNGVYNRGYLTTGATDTFQAILFTGNARISGYNFLAGDIAFSYGPMLQTFNSGSATVGLSSSGGALTAALPGTTDGQIYNTSLLPTGSNFLLFRGNSSGNYTASIQATAVPEPASWALMGTGLIVAAGLRYRLKGKTATQ